MSLPERRWIFFIIACPMVFVGAIALLLFLLPGKHLFLLAPALEVCLAMALPLGVGILLSAVLTVPAARRATKILDEFRNGNYLARWTYDPGYWSAFVESEHRRLSKTAWAFSGSPLAAE